MSDLELIAAILTVALNVSRPRMNNVSEPERGNADWQLIMKQYQRFVEVLEAHKKNNLPPDESALRANNG